MEQGPTVTEAAIKRLARSKSYDRGENYYDQGAVINVTLRGDTLRGEVEGSQYEPYQVQIEFDDTDIVETACSCPYDHGGICKHRVAVLLTYVRDPDRIDQRPSVSELLADADPAELREVILDLVEQHPELAARVETRLETGQDDDASVQSATINRDSIRQQVQYVLQPSAGKSGHAHDPSAAVETDVETLRDFLDQARTALDAGDGETALDILEPLVEELMDEEWLALSYDDSQAIFEFFDEVDQVLAEALLTVDLSETARQQWDGRLWKLEQEMGRYTHHPPYSVALEAVQRGWEFEPVQRAMDGETAAVDLWDGDPPWYAEDCIRSRLNVLERQDRIEEYLNLAHAADQIEAFVTMLIKEGRIDEAIEYGRSNVASPSEALTLAKTLRERDRSQAALEIAHLGLSFDGPKKAELAGWLRDRAKSMDESEIALEAAIAAFKTDPTLLAYHATEEFAGDEWPEIRDELLSYVANREASARTAREHVEIFLEADRYEEAIAIAERFPDDTVVEPVTEAVFEDHPQWTIEACKQQAEPIIEEGKSKRYRRAVQQLETAGKAAAAAEELDEWRAYVEELKDEHSRKYKLRPMLEELLQEFPE